MMLPLFRYAVVSVCGSAMACRMSSAPTDCPISRSTMALAVSAAS
jgi:hypothetical protein